MTIDRSTRILITGGTGLVGRALTETLAAEGYTNVVPVGSRGYDLRDDREVARMFSDVAPQVVFHLAARVHGLGGNAKYKSDILYENVCMNTFVIEQARRSGVAKLVAMGSGCVYPELPGQEELFEEQVWNGPPHPSEDSYAHAKRLMLAQLIAAKHQYGFSSAFAISGNLYGPHDNFNPEDGHVIPSLVAKFFAARQANETVKVWGSGRAIRDFSHARDAARGLVRILENLEGPVNLGSGLRHPIADIVAALLEVCPIRMEWDGDRPDGQLRRYYNLSKLQSTGFQPSVPLRDGVKQTYDWYVRNHATARH